MTVAVKCKNCYSKMVGFICVTGVHKILEVIIVYFLLTFMVYNIICNMRLQYNIKE